MNCYKLIFLRAMRLTFLYEKLFLPRFMFTSRPKGELYFFGLFRTISGRSFQKGFTPQQRKYTISIYRSIQTLNTCKEEIPHVYIQIHTKAKKKICVFTVTCQKNLGSVGQDNFFYFHYQQNRKQSFPVPESDISFSKFPVSRHLLKLFYDELCSFSTFFALNFDKKLVVE